MTNTEAALRTLVTILLALTGMIGWAAEPVQVLAPAEDTTSRTWDCLRYLGYHGSPVDEVEAFYPSRVALLLCS